MSDSDLARIRKKVRRLTASPSQQQLSDADLDDAINTFILYDFPENLRLFSLRRNYEFFTQVGVDTYDLPSNTKITVHPPMYVAGYQVLFSQSQSEFYQLWPKPAYSQDVSTGDGTQGPYSFTLTNTPILQETFSVSAQIGGGATITVYDDGSGVLTGDGSGVIDYQTGQANVTFSQPIPDGNTINSQYYAYSPGRPTSCLFFDQQFVLRPVPDAAYRCQIEAYFQPAELLVSNQSPELAEWWQYISFGAAIKILQDRRDLPAVQEIMPFFQEQENLCNRRSIIQMSNERVATIYSNQTLYAGGAPYPRF